MPQKSKTGTLFVVACCTEFLAAFSDLPMASYAARAIFRSSSGKATALLSAGARAGPARSLFRIASKRSFSQCAVRVPVEMSFCVESMFPFHSATSSALMTSMLSVSRNSYGWLSEVFNDDV